MAGDDDEVEEQRWLFRSNGGSEYTTAGGATADGFMKKRHASDEATRFRPDHAGGTTADGFRNGHDRHNAGGQRGFQK
ncbi:hypothetical protein Hypma_004849 [Hypsizygus marmoreus]|uniref:Uncharacterized protein n=1 Tax=Hypsizygus marmoreus TaxID=39966 RepID=A0A369IZK7_HYPMA|nr:hypothetical protein Hypma_004849 [Hypsizygus marmoreus]